MSISTHFHLPQAAPLGHSNLITHAPRHNLSLDHLMHLPQAVSHPEAAGLYYGLGVQLSPLTGSTDADLEDPGFADQRGNRWDFILSDECPEELAMQYKEERARLGCGSLQALPSSQTPDTAAPVAWSDQHISQIQCKIEAEFGSPQLPHQTSLYNSLTASSILSVKRSANKRRLLRAISQNSAEQHRLEQQLLALRQQRVVYDVYMAYSGLGM